jgi:hypothetical protein
VILGRLNRNPKANGETFDRLIQENMTGDTPAPLVVGNVHKGHLHLLGQRISLLRKLVGFAVEMPKACFSFWTFPCHVVYAPVTLNCFVSFHALTPSIAAASLQKMCP